MTTAGSGPVRCVCGHEADMHAPDRLGLICHGCLWVTDPWVPLRHPVVPEPGPVIPLADRYLGPTDLILRAIQEEA